ncbi:MAG: choice-of-anchor J domain-containing protein [Saprospiraceae bacterium]|nr:choice-of-anchor J domain-containing protein [Saprospiraceae bacterium]
MRLLYIFTLLFIGQQLIGQTNQEVIFSENFDNGCILPAGWEVNLSGNPNAVWYVDSGLRNNDQNGTSMNGSCFLVIDDDATGDNTPAFVCDVVTPPFNTQQYPTITFSADIHYRDFGPDNEKFQVILTDGVTETVLRTFTQGNSTGDSLHEYINVKYDLSLLTNSTNARIIFRYDDGGGFAWWAAIDNIQVVGSGVGQNVVAETFNGCTKPNGWETQVLTGDDDWNFGLVTNPQTTWAGTSMDGSCLAYFDDDLLGDSAASSSVRLYSPWFDGTQFGRFTINYDIIFRYYNDRVALYVQHGDGSEYLVQEAEYDLGGPHFPNYIHGRNDLSPFRSQQMRVFFQYDDQQTWAWWLGIDNVKITGDGVANDLCTNAKELFTGENCAPQNTFTALFDGPVPACITKPAPGLWYRWKADFSGTALLHTGSDFNDVINVFNGDCANPQPILCDDHDEHGFTGETSRFQVTEGVEYFIRVCGKEEGFGVPRGSMCVRLEQEASAPVIPENDNCSGALPLDIGAPCLGGNNRNASTSNTIPSLNQLARADVWYSFTAPALQPGEALEIASHADFSDILTLYKGSCNNLEEVAGNHLGHTLTTSDLNAGTGYLIQIAGNFATVEGAVCPEIQVKQINAPVNDNCVAATNVQIGGPCTQGTNTGATFSGNLPPCVPALARDVWFKFTAPASGSIRVNSGADFQHILAVWKGDCNGLTPVSCIENPLRCNGFVTFGGLSSGQTYYLQIGSQYSAAGISSGEVCIKITDGALQPEFTALELTITEKCIDVDVAELEFDLSGGVPPYTFNGNAEGDILPSGSEFFTIVEDANGCQIALSGIVDECQGSVCNVAATLAASNPSCFGATDGHLTVNIASGTGPYLYLWSTGATTAELTGIGAGAYTVTVTDALECDVEVSATLTQPEQILIAASNIIHPSQSLANGAISVDITGGSGALSYLWLLNGQPFASGTEDLVSIGAGDYQLVVTDANGCTAVLNVTLTATSGTNDISEAFFTEVFPNPARDKATLAVSFPAARTLYLSITDASGKLIHSWNEYNVTEQNIPLEVKNLPSGTYQLRIVTGFESAVEQLVIR